MVEVSNNSLIIIGGQSLYDIMPVAGKFFPIHGRVRVFRGQTDVTSSANILLVSTGCVATQVGGFYTIHSITPPGGHLNFTASHEGGFVHQSVIARYDPIIPLPIRIWLRRVNRSG